jgi:undecaprenyl-diphosphatase
MIISPFLIAALLGLIEGATEFIPVSSTGHLILAQAWLGFTGQKENAFIIFIQLGAILAVLWIYRRKVVSLLKDWRRSADVRRLWVNLVIGTLPAVAIGLPTERWIEKQFFNPLEVSLALVLGGVAILAVERWRKPPSVETMDRIPIRMALGVGAFQVLAVLFPGVSRSGATIMGGLLLGMSRTAATEFSFFLAIPAMFGASAVKMFEARHVIGAGDIPMFAIGFVVFFFAALLVIRGLMAYVSRHSFVPFAWYRICFGIACLALFLHHLTP